MSTDGKPKSWNKIKSIDELAAIAAQARADGKTVALAHGAFDLLHFGHVRHLEAAARQGDVLMVTITADAYVNKGPNRPVFPGHTRAEMLASLECVDWVGINESPSAEPVLKAIRPSVYVKGKEYAVDDDDVTGKIVAERDAVTDGGGRLEFTDDETFSSSSLLNQHFNIYNPQLQQFLDRLRADDGLKRLLALIERASDMRVRIVGDTIIDEYQYVSAMGKAAKENLIATRYQRREVFAGGVVAAANHVASFCKEVELVTCLGTEDSYEDLVRETLRDNVRLSVIYKEGAPTTRKVRFVEHGYAMRKLFEVCMIEDAPLSLAAQTEIDNMASDNAGDFDLVVVNDFGHGLIAPSTVGRLTTESRFLAVNAQTNSANFGFNLISKYPTADLVCIDQPEARLAAGDRFSDLEKVVGERLPAILNCERIIVTAGKHGCYTFDRDEGLRLIPALSTTIVDTMGAGDAFLSIAAPMAAAGGLAEDVGFLGNAAGAMMVGIVGHRSSIEKVPLIKFVTALMK